ncbi:MAG: type II toxin-antitoxin system PemK/MazF family toxin [Dehalococcoidales bacterium]|jgi:mRNA interferase MazF|nr:type II toxin-antitoxin system PemK/MazF family toxin [Dehalococcoidales bacterium]
MKRGEVWWAEQEPPAGKRPVLLLSRDEAYTVRELVVVAPVTTRIRNIPSEVSLGTEDGLSKPCVVNLDTITTIAKASLQDKLTTLNPEKMKSVEVALHFALGLTH